MKLSQIAKILEGSLCGEDFEVKTLKSLETASLGDFSIVLDRKHLKLAQSSKASALISFEECPGKSVIVVARPRAVFAKAVALFERNIPRKGISKKANISKKAKIGKDVFIDDNVKVEAGVELGDRVCLLAGVYVGHNSKIGENTLLYSNVSVYHEVEIGANCIIHAGAVIGADGFGFEVNARGEWEKVPQIGKVIIGDRVEIGANSCVDRGCIQDTIVADGTKLDNFVQIAHNCYVGENNVFSAFCAMAGSTKVLNNNMWAGQTATAGHLTVGNGVIAMGRTGITKDIEDKKIISGFPAQEHKVALREEAILKEIIKSKKRKVD